MGLKEKNTLIRKGDIQVRIPVELLKELEKEARIIYKPELVGMPATANMLDSLLKNESFRKKLDSREIEVFISGEQA